MYTSFREIYDFEIQRQMDRMNKYRNRGIPRRKSGKFPVVSTLLRLMGLFFIRLGRILLQYAHTESKRLLDLNPAEGRS